MALARPKPSRESLQALKDGLQDISATNTGTENWFRQYQRSKEYHQFYVYVLGVGAVTSRRAPLDAAQPRGWRFLWPHPSDGPTICEVVRAKKNSKPVMTSRWSIAQRTVDKSLAGLTHLERTVLKEGNFELRVLTIPGLQIEAFWLKSKSKGQPDKLVPFLSLYEEIKPMKVYLPEAFFDAAKILAQRRLASPEV